MQTTEESARDLYVQPGECRVVTEPVVLRTVLGSCVGIVFRVPRLGIGALCHPMLPRCPVNALVKLSASAKDRYVDFVIREMARHLESLGAVRAEIQVKLFGGADVLSVSVDSARPSVGKLNCEAAIRVLAEEGLVVAASSLGGKSGMHIRFRTGTGEVLLRRLDSIPSQERTKSAKKAPLCRSTGEG